MGAEAMGRQALMFARLGRHAVEIEGAIRRAEADTNPVVPGRPCLEDSLDRFEPVAAFKARFGVLLASRPFSSRTVRANTTASSMSLSGHLASISSKRSPIRISQASRTFMSSSVRQQAGVRAAWHPGTSLPRDVGGIGPPARRAPREGGPRPAPMREGTGPALRCRSRP
jgi:hypothetical protein